MFWFLVFRVVVLMFDLVLQAIETSSKRVLAVKRMNKNVLIDRNQVLTIMTEALVMKEASAVITHILLFSLLILFDWVLFF